MLRSQALEAISQTSYAEKLRCTQQMDVQGWVDCDAVLQSHHVLPGRETLPVLVPHHQLPKRSMASVEGRATMIHALAHIELNAVDLALDMVWRFEKMPEKFYRDWAQIAIEEAHHHQLLTAHLQRSGFCYGDFSAHNGLWDMAEKTRSDVLARLALVPRTLEARGLDASLPIRNKLAQVGDHEAASILDVILRDEIGHVATGNYWYRYVCRQRGLEPVSTYARLAQQYHAPRLRGPFNLDARRAAGFEESELVELQKMSETASTTHGD